MSDTNKAVTSNGIGFFGLLAILFIGLRLTHFIAWSWWWVLAPLWALPALILGLFVAWLLFGVFYHAFKRWFA